MFVNLSQHGKCYIVDFEGGRGLMTYDKDCAATRCNILYLFGQPGNLIFIMEKSGDFEK